MTGIHWNLEILARAVQYKNLSVAATHVGLSQSQLSRIIAKLEVELQVVLLDRTVRRKSGWTRSALEIAEVFTDAESKLKSEIQALTHKQIAAPLRIGSLEGLAKLASEYCTLLFETHGLREIHLDIFEISELEERFEAGSLDLMFSFRGLGQQRHQDRSLIAGYQTVSAIYGDGPYKIFSHFEFTKKDLGKLPRLPEDRILISNSLMVRTNWLTEKNGSGWLPSPVEKKKGANSGVAYLIGSDLINPKIWDKLKKAAAELNP